MRAMTDPRRAIPDALQAQMKIIAFEFATQVVGILERSVVEVAGGFAPPKGAKPNKKVKAAKATPLPAKKGVTPVATGKTSAALEKRILAALRKTPAGLGAEQLNRALGTTTPQLTPALQSMLGSKRIAKQGKARGTKYVTR